MESGKLAVWTATEGQLRAFEAIAALTQQKKHGLLAIVGYAGVGKTTLIKMAKALNPAVVAPTGKAALRVSEATGIKAHTIHRWLYKPEDDHKTGGTKFARRTGDELEIPRSKLVIIDEASMVSVDVWMDIWRTAQQHGLKIVAVGDGFQLPPVQDDRQAKFSILDPQTVQKHEGTLVELTEVLRQALDSPVVKASMCLRGGGPQAAAALRELLPIVTPEDFMPVLGATLAAGGVVISSTNATRFRVNSMFREACGYTNPVVGEQLLVLRNNYDLDVYNGEQVTFDGWAVPPTEAREVQDKYTGGTEQISFGVALVGGRRCVVAQEELAGGLSVGPYTLSRAAEAWARLNHYYNDDKLIPYLSANYGYCYTAHKSQGSEWPYALVILEPNIKLNTDEGRRWVYTAITRAKTMAAVFYGRL